MREEMYEMGSKFFIIPSDPETREDLLNVDRSTKIDLRQKHRLFVQNDWETNTIANVVMESLVKALYSHIKNSGISILNDEDGNSINFYDLLEITATNKQNENAEKTGNINVKFVPGMKIDGLVADDEKKEDKEVEFIAIDAAYSYPDNDKRTKAMLTIDKVARDELSNKYSILLPKDFMAIATCALFVENIYRQLVQKLVLTNKPAVTINFNDIIEFHAIKKEGNTVDIKLRPGMGAKLIIKSDETTEEDEDGFDD